MCFFTDKSSQIKLLEERKVVLNKKFPHEKRSWLCFALKNAQKETGQLYNPLSLSLSFSLMQLMTNDRDGVEEADVFCVKLNDETWAVRRRKRAKVKMKDEKNGRMKKLTQSSRDDIGDETLSLRVNTMSLSWQH